MTTQLVQAYLAAARACDDTALAAIVTSDFAMSVLPASLGMPPDAPFEHWKASVQGLKMKLMGGRLGIEVLEQIDAGNKIVLHLRNVDTVSVEGKAFTNEYIVILTTMEESGALKIKHLKEFVDSAFIAGFFGSA
ncbi:hypothetical protein EXIGLDRAFT_724270 [Exidia glandulosa HHB12029]|uniref:SnoaL-like domain-containing protein n=1 Tax=Exidia glandulosa HHB12029 TaxID=1314781 RepID=A0A165MT30_EXIGL|nr:hypothetical protein EXIGLDRAFT_724270 [Exidia glandulosa HHB12029]